MKISIIKIFIFKFSKTDFVQSPNEARIISTVSKTSSLNVEKGESENRGKNVSIKDGYILKSLVIFS